MRKDIVKIPNLLIYLLHFDDEKDLQRKYENHGKFSLRGNKNDENSELKNEFYLWIFWLHKSGVCQCVTSLIFISTGSN